MSSLEVFVIRPQPGNAATVAAACGRGLDAIGFPLFEIKPVPWRLPKGAFDAVLLGSANALRCGGSGLAAITRLPAYAVGETTAVSACEAGFRVAATGSGGLDQLLSRLAADGRQKVLRLAGKEHVPVDPPPGLAIETVIVYAARPLKLPAPLRAALGQGGVVLLHSAAAARHFAHQCDTLAIARGRLRLACLGPRIASAAGAGWGAVRSAQRPTDPALLALAGEMCQSAVSGVASSTNG